ncbi:agmatinase family protein [Myxosarcina sp. GI1]|uniref:agmatinase family protein n=1 Tax=Myxosarcina sp. GI1 TaxID=1541065 RepID=UPI000567147B|nr:agmatinase family protein [Myxosarcina sp. GI1]
MKTPAFDPNTVSKPNGNFFGFPYSWEEAKIVLLPVPWDVTTSYGSGASKAPQAIIDASTQLDWYDFDVPNAWAIGHGTLAIAPQISRKNQQMRFIAKDIIDHLEAGKNPEDKAIRQKLDRVDRASSELNEWVYQQSQMLLTKNKLVGLVGGDHSVPLGFIKALAEKHGEFGILQIDAHADLRVAYEGFTFSHASIMYNVLKLDEIASLVQVGVRDICEAEIALANSDPRVVMFDDWQLKNKTYEGVSWAIQVKEIIKAIPQKVYVSFDIDGLNPQFCPHTGTPVPGGLDFNQAIYLIQMLVKAKKTIIGFDLCEVAPGEASDWDGNVGARLLYKLSNLMYASQS